MMSVKEAASALEAATKKATDLEDENRTNNEKRAMVSDAMLEIEKAIVAGNGTGAMADELERLRDDHRACENREALLGRMIRAAHVACDNARGELREARRRDSDPERVKLDQEALEAFDAAAKVIARALRFRLSNGHAPFDRNRCAKRCSFAPAAEAASWRA